MSFRLPTWRVGRPGRATWASVLAGGVALTLTIAAFVLGPRFRSPQQAAADAQPPPPSLLTAVAEMRVVAEPLVLRGQVTPGESVKITAPAVATGPDAVVTAVKVQVGDRLVEGMVPVELRGRPLLCLVLPFPLYRDIPGKATGPDVSALQAALRRLGYNIQQSGTMDAATQSALSDLYRRRGYAAPMGDQAVVESAQSTHDSAQDAHTAAQGAYNTAQAAYDAAVQAGGDVDEAKAALDEAKAALDRAKAALDRAKAALDEARVVAGPMLVRSEVVGLTAAGQSVTAVPVTVGTVIESTEVSLLELDGQPPYVFVLATQNQAGMLEVGHGAEAFDEASGASARLRVASVATEATTEAETGQIGYPIRFEFQDEALDVVGRTVRVEVTTGTSLEPRLAVPVSAVYAAADRSTYVTVVKPDGSTVDVPVETGQFGGGWVEVRATPASAIRPGTVVVVGVGTG